MSLQDWQNNCLISPRNQRKKSLNSFQSNTQICCLADKGFSCVSCIVLTAAKTPPLHHSAIRQSRRMTTPFLMGVQMPPMVTGAWFSAAVTKAWQSSSVAPSLNLHCT